MSFRRARGASRAGIVLGVLLVVAGAPSHSDAPSPAEQQVRAVEQRWLDHLADPAVVATLLADDFVHVLPGGFISKAEHLEYLRAHPQAFAGTRRFSELRVRIYGETAVATGIVSTQPGDGGAARASAFTDVFVHRHGEWLAVNAQETPLPGAPQPH
jgi:hypothetical protein